MLTQQRLKQLLHYNPETGAWSRKLKRCGRGGSAAVGTITKLGYRRIKLDDVSYLSSYLVWLYITGVAPSCELDHEDGDYSNDRWANLRDATHSQNCANRKRPKNNTSGFKGVHFRRDNQFNPWQAAITVRKKHIHLGFHATPEEAHAHYVKAAKQYFGEFARAT